MNDYLTVTRRSLLARDPYALDARYSGTHGRFCCCNDCNPPPPPEDSDLQRWEGEGGRSAD